MISWSLVQLRAKACMSSLKQKIRNRCNICSLEEMISTWQTVYNIMNNYLCENGNNTSFSASISMNCWTRVSYGTTARSLDACISASIAASLPASICLTPAPRPLPPRLYYNRNEEIYSFVYRYIISKHLWRCNICSSEEMPSVLWCCWLGGRKGIRPVKNMEWWGAGVVIYLERDSGTGLPRLSWKKAVKWLCVCVCSEVVMVTGFTLDTITSCWLVGSLGFSIYNTIQVTSHL